MTIEEQLKEIIIDRYKSVRAFTQAINIPYSTVDTMLKRGIGGTGVTTVIKIFHKLELDIESISTGELKPLTQNKTAPAAKSSEGDIQKARLIKNYDRLNSEGKEKLTDYSEDLSGNPKYIEAEPEQRYRTIRYFNQPVSAGLGEWLDDDSYTEMDIPDIKEYTQVDFAVRVHGDSMLPDYEDGDIVLVHSQNTTLDGDVGVWWVDSEGGLIKEYRRGSLYPHNKKYNPITLTGKAYQCFGRVIAKLEDEE